MAIDYVGLNQALSSNSGLLGTAANFMARNQDREMYRDQFDKDLSLRSRALGVQQELGNRELDVQQRGQDLSHEARLKEIEVLEQQNDYMSRYYDATNGKINAETEGIDLKNAEVKTAQIERETISLFRNVETTAINVGAINRNEDGTTTVDATKYVTNPELFKLTQKAINNPAHAKALSLSIPEAKQNGALVAARTVKGEDGAVMVQIGIQGKDGKLMPLPGEDDSLMTPDEYVDYAWGTASPTAYGETRGIVNITNSMADQIKGQLSLSVNASGIDNPTALAMEKEGLSSAARSRREVDNRMRLRDSTPENRAANAQVDNLLSDQTLNDLGKTAEAQYKHLIKDKGGMFKVGKSAADTITSPKKFAKAIEAVYYGNQNRLVEMGFPEKLADYEPRHHQLLAEITAAVHENDDAWPTIFKYWGPGLIANKMGLMDDSSNNTITPEIAQKMSLNNAKRY